MTQETWQYQGRQRHGEFGHGTAPHGDRPVAGRGGGPPAPAALDARTRYVAYGAVGHLKRDDARHYEAKLASGMLGHLQDVVAGHPATAHLGDETYRAQVLDHALNPQETRQLRRTAELTHGAATLDDLAPATTALAGVIASAGLPRTGKALAVASRRRFHSNRCCWEKPPEPWGCGWLGPETGARRIQFRPYKWHSRCHTFRLTRCSACRNALLRPMQLRTLFSTGRGFCNRTVTQGAWEHHVPSFSARVATLLQYGDVWRRDAMIVNVIDKRTDSYRWQSVDAVMEPTFHDNTVKNSDYAEPQINIIQYDDRSKISISEIIAWGNSFDFPVTIYIYDQGFLSR